MPMLTDLHGIDELVEINRAENRSLNFYATAWRRRQRSERFLPI